MKSCYKFLSSQFVGDAVEPRAHGAVNYQIAGAQHGTADQVSDPSRSASGPSASAGAAGRRKRLALDVLERRRGGDRTSITLSASSFNSSNRVEISGRYARRWFSASVWTKLRPCPSSADRPVGDQFGQLPIADGRIAEQLLHARIPHDGEARSVSDHGPKLLVAMASSNAALAYGRAIVVLSAMASPPRSVGQLT